MRNLLTTFASGFLAGVVITFALTRPDTPEPPPSGEVTQAQFDQFFKSRSHQFPVVSHRFHTFETVRTDTVTIRVPAEQPDRFRVMFPDGITVSRDEVTARFWNPFKQRWEGEVFSVPPPSRWHLTWDARLYRMAPTAYGADLSLYAGRYPFSLFVSAGYNTIWEGYGMAGLRFRF